MMPQLTRGLLLAGLLSAAMPGRTFAASHR